VFDALRDHVNLSLHALSCGSHDLVRAADLTGRGSRSGHLG
jgi:hypothetical protein